MPTHAYKSNRGHFSAVLPSRQPNRHAPAEGAECGRARHDQHQFFNSSIDRLTQLPHLDRCDGPHAAYAHFLTHTHTFTHQTVATSLQFYPHANQIATHLLRVLNVAVHVHDQHQCFRPPIDPFTQLPHLDLGDSTHARGIYPPSHADRYALTQIHLQIKQGPHLCSSIPTPTRSPRTC